jgi:hypothetical protein
MDHVGGGQVGCAHEVGRPQGVVEGSMAGRLGHPDRVADRGSGRRPHPGHHPVFYAVEFVVWLPIELNRRLREALRRPAKEVNKPALRLKL